MVFLKQLGISILEDISLHKNGLRIGKGKNYLLMILNIIKEIIGALIETKRIMKDIDKVYPEVEKDPIKFKIDEFEKNEVKKDKPDPNQKIFDLIAKGEGKNIEFKATLQKSIDNPKISPKVIENSVIKSIAGFCNTEGGNLLIGVNDNGDIIGIEEDNFQSNDKFKNHLKNILDARVIKIVFSFIKTEFFNIEGKTVCCIECNKSDVPLFVDYEGVTHFYKRNLESTDSLNPQETLEYCKKDSIESIVLKYRLILSISLKLSPKIKFVQYVKPNCIY